MIQVFPMVLGAGPTDRSSVVGAAKVWGNSAVVEVSKTGVVVFPVVKGDVCVVVFVTPTAIEVDRVSEATVPPGEIIASVSGIRFGVVSV